jgi:hypothetical protein
MRIYGIECIDTGKFGVLNLWSTTSGHSISYNEYGCVVVCGNFEYYMNRLASGYILVCKFDEMHFDLFKAIMGKGCPENIKQLMTLYGKAV